MKKWYKILSREDKIILIYFIVSTIILFFIILWDFNNIWVIMERAKKIFSFWLILFVSIFLPRRILIRSKKFRYFVLKIIRKKYPIILCYRKRIFEFIFYINFFFMYIEFYLERILKYLLVGTKVKWLKPYKEKEVAEKWEFRIQIVREIIFIIHYIVFYVLKIIQEIIKFFDNATIYKIIRSRILGFMLITIGYIIIGVNFFFYYIGSILIIFLIYNSLIIYWEYKNRKGKEEFKNDNEILTYVLFFFGFVNKIRFIISEIKELRMNNLLFFKVLKFKKENFLLYALKRKYGVKKVTKYALTMEGLTKVMLYENSYVLILFIPFLDIKEKNIIIYYKSKYNFVTEFYEKKVWYEEEDVLKQKKEESFNNSILGFENNFVNELEFQITFLRELIMSTELKDLNYEVCFYYKMMLEKYFEFNIVVKFLKFIEKKIEEEGGYEKFKQKYYIETGVWEKMDSFLNKFAVTKEIEKKECEWGLVIVIYCDLLISLNYNKNHEKEFSELIDIKYSKFVLNLNKEKEIN